MSFIGADTRYRLFSPAGYNIPKPRFLYYVSFVSRFIDPQFSRYTGFTIREIDRIQMSYDVQEFNQYNKKRLYQNKIDYSPLNFTMYDVADNYALKLIEAYNRYYYNEFDNKNVNSWNYDTTINSFESTGSWGLKADQSPANSYFFDRIEIYEFYDQTYSKINFINPKFTNVAFSSLDHTANDPSTVSMSCKYEGLVIESINALVTPDLADKFGIGFKNDLGLPPGALRIPGVINLVNAGTNLLTNVFSSFGLGSFASQNIATALTQQGLAALAPKINSVFGQSTFDTIDKTASLLSSVQNRTATGDIVRDISTGSFAAAISNLVI